MKKPSNMRSKIDAIKYRFLERLPGEARGARGVPGSIQINKMNKCKEQKQRKKERKLKEDMQREYMQKAQPHRSQHASGAFGPGADLIAYGKFRSGPSEGGGASEKLHTAGLNKKTKIVRAACKTRNRKEGGG